MEPVPLPRLERPLSLSPSVEVWTARQGGRRVVVRRYPPPRPGSPWPPPPDPAVLAAVNHPTLVRFLGHGRDEDGAELHTFVEMRGETLAEALRRGPLTNDQWLHVVSACARGLRWLHRRCPAAPRLHGDVSPGNIHLSVDGRVRWLDVRADRPATFPAGPDVILGTLPYLAPEVLQGNPPMPASEVFALGLVALASALGPLPWNRASSPREVLQAFLETPPSSLADALPTGPRERVAAMLHPVPAERPTADDVVSRLRPIPPTSRLSPPGPCRPRAAILHATKAAPDGQAASFTRPDPEAIFDFVEPMPGKD